MTEAKGATAIANKLKDVAAMGSEEVARQQKVRAATSQLKNAIGNLHGTKIRIPFDTEIKLASPILIAPLAIIALMYFISPLFVLLTLFFMGYVMFGYFELRSDTKDGLRIDEHRSQAEQIGIRAARASLNHREWSELLSWWANQYQSAMVRKVADSAFIAQTQVEAEKPIKQTA